MNEEGDAKVEPPPPSEWVPSKIYSDGIKKLLICTLPLYLATTAAPFC
jgi:hypothetical protein